MAGALVKIDEQIVSSAVSLFHLQGLTALTMYLKL